MRRPGRVRRVHRPTVAREAVPARRAERGDGAAAGDARTRDSRESCAVSRSELSALGWSALGLALGSAARRRASRARRPLALGKGVSTRSERGGRGDRRTNSSALPSSRVARARSRRRNVPSTSAAPPRSPRETAAAAGRARGRMAGRAPRESACDASAGSTAKPCRLSFASSEPSLHPARRPRCQPPPFRCPAPSPASARRSRRCTPSRASPAGRSRRRSSATGLGERAPRRLAPRAHARRLRRLDARRLPARGRRRPSTTRAGDAHHDRRPRRPQIALGVESPATADARLGSSTTRTPASRSAAPCATCRPRAPAAARRVARRPRRDRPRRRGGAGRRARGRFPRDGEAIVRTARALLRGHELPVGRRHAVGRRLLGLRADRVRAARRRAAARRVAAGASWARTPAPTRTRSRAGDLLFFSDRDDRRITHVGIATRRRRAWRTSRSAAAAGRRAARRRERPVRRALLRADFLSRAASAGHGHGHGRRVGRSSAASVRPGPASVPCPRSAQQRARGDVRHRDGRVRRTGGRRPRDAVERDAHGVRAGLLEAAGRATAMSGMSISATPGGGAVDRQLRRRLQSSRPAGLTQRSVTAWLPTSSAPPLRRTTRWRAGARRAGRPRARRRTRRGR